MTERLTGVPGGRLLERTFVVLTSDTDWRAVAIGIDDW